MPLQTLPPLARSYSQAQRDDIDDTLAEIASQWRRIGPRFDTGWMLVGPYITKTVTDAQRRMVQRADEYIPAVLEDTGQLRYVEPEVEPDTAALVGLTGAGYPVNDALSTATIRGKQAVADGATAPQALDFAGSWLSQSAMTVLADTMRGAEGLGRYVRNVGYVRMVHGGACGRCVILAGKYFKTNAGFLRHPRCKCTHIPAGEDVAGDWQTHPDAYFNSLNEQQQIKLMGSRANAQAIHDGADIGRVVNAYRPNAGMRLAQMGSVRTVNGMKFSSRESATVFFGNKRSPATGKRLREVSISTPRRLMPETIAQIAKDDADRLRLLKRHHWIVDQEFEALSPADKAMALWRGRNDPLS